MKRGACPSVRAPMQTGDGLLARLMPAGSGASREAWLTLCEAAERYGNGVLEVTSRGSLQVRGLRAETADAFAEAIAELGVYAPDGPVIMVDPLGGEDVRAMAEEYKNILAAQKDELHHKFSVLCEEGRSSCWDDMKIDKRISLNRSLEDHQIFIGYFPNHNALGIALPFGNVEAATLRTLLTATEAYEIRTAPHRTLLFFGLSESSAQNLKTQAEALGFITDAADPRRLVSACPGAPACASGHIATRALARELAAALPSPLAFHVSGCSKGCAHPKAAPLTIVGRTDGCAVVLNGRAGDEPVVVVAPGDVVGIAQEFLAGARRGPV